MMRSHDLATEFPEYVDKIAQLTQQDSDFANMASEYHRLDSEIAKLESRDMPISDQDFEELKMQRLRLRDQIYQRLNNVQG